MRHDRSSNFTNGQITPGGQHSFWIDTTPDTDYQPLQDNIEVDVVIVGGGITGITTATFLKEAGKTVAILESNKVIKNVTGHTTAKITSLHGLIYHDLSQRFGEENAARIYANANQAAIERIASLVEQRNISCDFQRTEMYVYTELMDHLDAVEKEVEDAQRIGLPVSLVKETPLPFNIEGAVRLENQAQFHPRKYLLALAEDIPKDGSYIFEQTRALDIIDDDPCVVVTDKGEIKASKVVIATHFPFYDKGFFYARLYPYYSYALGIRIKGEIPEGMYFTQDGDEFAIRNQPTENGPILVISGGNHKVGQGGDILVRYKNLEKHSRERFDVESINYYWSTEDYDTPDRVPYIGKSPSSENVYMASGFGGWGMTNGTLSAMIVSDLILERENPWAPFYNPSRIDLRASSRGIIAENVNVMKEFGKGFLVRSKREELASLHKGEGKKIVIDHKEVAAYKDEQEKLYVVSPICTHLSCVVNWNNAERTWDCPCHGSRFNYDGKIIHGPALRKLKKIDVDQQD